jgi:hypothetical protein
MKRILVILVVAIISLFNLNTLIKDNNGVNIGLDCLRKAKAYNSEYFGNEECHTEYILLDTYSGSYNGYPGTYYEQYFECEGSSGPCSMSGARTKFYYERISMVPKTICDETGPSEC